MISRLTIEQLTSNFRLPDLTANYFYIFPREFARNIFYCLMILADSDFPPTTIRTRYIPTG